MIGAPPGRLDDRVDGRLIGRRAVVTGGARGIGGGIAAALAAEGAQVVILDRLVAEGERAAAEIGGRFVEVDLADAADAERATEQAVAELGGIDVLVNCAGIFSRTQLIDLTVAEWDLLFAINTRAMLTTMQVAARTMIPAGSGRIVNLASMAAKKGGASEAAYAASKAAVVALTRAVAFEWGRHGITANSICPGYVLTEMGAGTRTPELVASWEALSPLGRLGTIDDVAAVALFLSLPESAYLTGQAINVTGGMVTH
ncbi:SDR family NAD(P)-dependent oxidoreductase [Lysinimonas soli]|uniref:SDR family NAD(P)-dependent oxidoreductase n=1 Tax=Lysinimonas soli TaxID=1074233 RepID=A0ABW0NT31_9MICO